MTDGRTIRWMDTPSYVEMGGPILKKIILATPNQTSSIPSHLTPTFLSFLSFEICKDKIHKHILFAP